MIKLETRTSPSRTISPSPYFDFHFPYPASHILHPAILSGDELENTRAKISNFRVSAAGDFSRGMVYRELEGRKGEGGSKGSKATRQQDKEDDSSVCSYRSPCAPCARRRLDSIPLNINTRPLNTRHLPLLLRLPRTTPTDARAPLVIHLPSARHVYAAPYRPSGRRCVLDAQVPGLRVDGRLCLRDGSR